MTVKTCGIAELTEEQAKRFAFSILGDIKRYVAEHRAEYEKWLSETTEVRENEL